jgi:threonine dehydratase
MGAFAPIFKGNIMTSNTKPIGVAFEDQDIIGSNFVLAGGELGYTAEANGAVTQATDKSTGVTLNKSMGRITMNGAALAGNTAVSFTMTNSTISANDAIIVNVSGGGTAAAYTTYISSMASGSAVITLRNLTAGSLSEAVIINFATIHGAS